MGTATYDPGLATFTVAFSFCSVKRKRGRTPAGNCGMVNGRRSEDVVHADLPRRALMPEPRSGEDPCAMTAQSDRILPLVIRAPSPGEVARTPDSIRGPDEGPSHPRLRGSLQTGRRRGADQAAWAFDVKQWDGGVRRSKFVRPRSCVRG